ncbi:MAG TPA: hypothetical protein PLG07_07735, partial [Phenylobacterium sp.]|nr:hypothetical protein [Phenylobacterium sp.]
MVTLNRIYTRTGDAGMTRLATGAEVSKSDARVATYGEVRTFYFDRDAFW